MSLVQKTDVYQRSDEKTARKSSDYGFILALICLALALLVAGVAFTPTIVVPPDAAYVGP
jgi:Na+/proline symporter